MRKMLFLCFIFIFSPMASASLYHILGVMSDSPLEQITKNYERIKHRIHPSNNSNSRESRERLQELEESYTVLSDPNRRAEYDKHLKIRPPDKVSNFYKLLGVLSDSSAEQMTGAYRKLRMPIHPDRNNNNKESNDRFKELQKAYRTLANPVLRSKHDTALRESHFIPHSRKRNKQRAEELRETTPDRRGQTKAGMAGNGGLDTRAQFTAGVEPDSEREEVAAWKRQVFELAKGLEKDGGQEDRAESIVWYRTLAQENHLEAAWRLALLLEETDPGEALYRYGQVQVLDTDGELVRSAVFRQAQIYQAGVYKEETEIFPPNPEKAAELYEEAFHLGVPAGEIARQYDKRRDYPKALEWQQKKGNGSDKQQITGDTKRAREKPMLLMQNKWEIWGENRKKLTELHSAILHKDKVRLSTQVKQKAVIAMIRSVFDEKTDINAQDSRRSTALHLAIERYYLDVVQMLLEMGADASISDGRGNNVLAAALIYWDLGEIKIEGFQGKARASARDRKAIQPILSSLIERVDLSARNHQGHLPIYLAIKHDHPKTAVEIIQKGGIESLSDRELYGFLYFAIESDHSEVAEAIIERGRIKSLTSEKHDKLFQLAISKGKPNVVSLLKQIPVREGEKSPQTKPGLLSKFLSLCQFSFSDESVSSN